MVLHVDRLYSLSTGTATVIKSQEGRKVLSVFWWGTKNREQEYVRGGWVVEDEEEK